MIPYLTLLEFDNFFEEDENAQSISGKPEPLTTKDQAKQFVNEMFCEASNNLSFIKHCNCGKTKGNFYKICPHCKSPVVHAYSCDLSFTAWLGIPEGFPSVLHPVVYKAMGCWSKTYQGVNLADALLDPDAELPYPLNKTLGTGYTYLEKNFDNVVNYLANFKPLNRTKSKKAKTKYFLEFIKKYRHTAFVRNLPILNSLLHTLTKVGDITYDDEAGEKVLKALITLSNTQFTYKHKPHSESFLDQRMKLFYDSYLEYVDSIAYGKVDGKRGYIRKFILGSRYHCSYRSVITPITDYHAPDELHLPWRHGVTLLKLEILNVMLHRSKYNYSLKRALTVWERALSCYDPIVHEIMNTLIDECPYKGLPSLWGRNPTLQLGSIQLLFITKIKTSPSGNVVGMSPCVISAANADYDGDAKHIWCL